MASTFDARLGLYLAAAGAAIGSSAHADIIGATDLGLTITTGESMLLDFGPGFGEVFGFEVRSTNYFTSFTNGGSVSSTVTYSSARLSFNPLFQFNANQTLWNAASFVNNSSLGGYSYDNDPARLAFGVAIDNGLGWSGPMTTSFSTSHDIAQFASFFRNSTSTLSSGSYSYGAWAGGARGFIGFRMPVADPLLSEGSYIFGWIDVETSDDLIDLTIHGWGLNTSPNSSITAGAIPAPGVGGLAMLATGRQYDPYSTDLTSIAPIFCART